MTSIPAINISFRTLPTVIPNGVRNLRPAPMACPLLRRAFVCPSILDSSSCAPQNDREGGAPQNGINKMSFRTPQLSFRRSEESNIYP